LSKAFLPRFVASSRTPERTVSGSINTSGEEVGKGSGRMGQTGLPDKVSRKADAEG
jgi:hypothetical protein